MIDSIQVTLLTALQKTPQITAQELIRIAGCGAVSNVSRLREQAYIDVHGIGQEVDSAGRKREMKIYVINKKGLALTDRKNRDKQFPSRKPKLEVYKPRPRAPGETPGVLIAPMLQPRYVPPRWESAR